jgi:hypothetical protein
VTVSPIRPRRARPSSVSSVAAAALAAIGLAACGGSGSSSSHSSTSSSASATASSAATTTAGSGGASATTFTATAFASGVSITHPTPGGKSPVNQPDDITNVGSNIFVAFQNGVGPQGEATTAGNQGAGNRNSTVVEFSNSGSVKQQWELAGHVDGLTADPSTGHVIASANEDANPHLYEITPGNAQPTTYKVPALPHNGGLDAISFWHGMMLVSASAPGTSGKAAPQASYPAVYVVSLNAGTHTASIRALFGDEAAAKAANGSSSSTTHLALTDPDSNFVVPAYAQRFGGDFALDSQGDYRQIFVGDASGKQLSVLKISQSIDDFGWASGPSATLYVTDGSADLIYRVTGPFQKGMEVVAVTPCDAGNAPAACPAPGFPNNYMGVLNQTTGAVTKFALSTPINPAGLLFTP